MFGNCFERFHVRGAAAAAAAAERPSSGAHKWTTLQINLFPLFLVGYTRPSGRVRKRERERVLYNTLHIAHRALYCRTPDTHYLRTANKLMQKVQQCRGWITPRTIPKTFFFSSSLDFPSPFHHYTALPRRVIPKRRFPQNDAFLYDSSVGFGFTHFTASTSKQCVHRTCSLFVTQEGLLQFAFSNYPGCPPLFISSISVNTFPRIIRIGRFF